MIVKLLFLVIFLWNFCIFSQTNLFFKFQLKHLPLLVYLLLPSLSFFFFFLCVFLYYCIPFGFRHTNTLILSHCIYDFFKLVSVLNRVPQFILNSCWLGHIIRVLALWSVMFLRQLHRPQKFIFCLLLFLARCMLFWSWFASVFDKLSNIFWKQDKFFFSKRFALCLNSTINQINNFLIEWLFVAHAYIEFVAKLVY